MTVSIRLTLTDTGPAWKVEGNWDVTGEPVATEVLRVAARWLLDEADSIEAGSSV